MRIIPALACLITLHPALAELPSPWTPGSGARWSEDRLTFETKKEATLDVELLPGTDQSLALLLVAEGGMGSLSLVKQGEETARFSIRKGKTGDTLNLMEMRPDPDKKPGAWIAIPGSGQSLQYQPGEKAGPAWKNLKAAGLSPEGWVGREIEMRLIHRGNRVEVYIDGVLIANQEAGGKPLALRLNLSVGDAVKPLGQRKQEVSPAFAPLAIKAFVPGSPKEDHLATVDGVPFLKVGKAGASEKSAGVDLRKACWPFAKELPSSYFSSFDSGPMYLHDLRMPTFWAPVADYASLHLLVRRTPDAPEQGGRFSVRIGAFGHGALGGRGQVIDHVYHVEIPKETGERHLVLPLTEALAQDLSGGKMQVSFNKEMRLSRRAPDPSRFEYRPLGLPPGVEIVGATLERSPIQWRVTASEPGALFEGSKQARFSVILNNTSDQPLEYTLDATAKDSAGHEIADKKTGRLAAGATETIPWTLAAEQWGYHDLAVRLKVKGRDDSWRRVTSFALLPPDTRQHRESSPFGTWSFDGGHMTCDDPEVLGPIFKKAGLRFGMGRFPEARGKWGVRNNFEAKAIDKPEKYEQWIAKAPDSLPAALLLHEHSVSGDHASRVPDLFTGRKPYVLSSMEQERFKKLWDGEIAMAKIMRERFPNVHLRLGNGPLPTKEEFLRAKFPAELFDSLGNEAGSFGRLPEAQPPDFIANNASLWMDNELVKGYGYDKPVTQCYEVIYPSTNPGNLSQLDQAAYFVRHGIHSLAWGIPEIRFGALDDVGNSYRYSNWGASGMMNPWPHLNPKPAIVAVSTLTRMLDGATFRAGVPTSSPSAYAVQFEGPSKRNIYVLWTLRGERAAKLRLSGGEWSVTDWEGNTHPLKGGEVTLTPMPVYLVGDGKLEEMTLGAPRYSDAPGKNSAAVDSLASLENWEIEAKTDPMLESHNPMTPRRPAVFQYAATPENGGIEVSLGEPAPGSKVLPMISSLKARKALELPGEPTEIGLQIEGNSGWGRVIYELEDASGQKWTSIGASRNGEISEWMLDWLPAEFAQSKDQKVTQADWNTNDVFGVSAINFDGWRYVGFPLPGNYPGEKNPWPANSQWRWDKDGIVHYPLKVTRLIFELPENILKLTEYAPLKNQSIRVKDLAVEYGTQGGIKETPYEQPSALVR